MSHDEREEFERQGRLERKVQLAVKELAEFMNCSGFKLPMGNGEIVVFGPVENIESLSGRKDGGAAVATLMAKARSQS